MNIMLCRYIHTVSLTTLIGYLFICNVLAPIVTLRVARMNFVVFYTVTIGVTCLLQHLTFSLAFYFRDTK